MGRSTDEVQPPNSEKERRKAYRGPERRTRRTRPRDVDPVVLTRKLAEVIDDIDLTGCRVGDRLPLRRYEAGILVAEGWATRVPSAQRRKPRD